MTDRSKPYTNKEFQALSRNADGRLTGDFPMMSIWFTDKQVELLHEDDWSYYNECQEEMDIMWAEEWIHDSAA